MLDRWLSPDFGPTGCLGALLLFVLMAGVALGLLTMVWWNFLGL